MTTPTAVIAEPLCMVRTAMRQLLESQCDLTVVDEAADAEELLDRVLSHRPDLLVMELVYPKADGIALIGRIQRFLPQVNIVVLSQRDDAHGVRSALTAGACAYVSKNADLEELRFAIRAALRGQNFVSPALSRHALERRRAKTPTDSALSPRQHEVLHLVGRGHSTKEIASLLGVSTKTVETHRARLMQTLGLGNTAALVSHAVRHVLEEGESGR